ncbi:MAG: hypothetical protein WDM76_02475 [Limisphaerales bacterium]
MEFTATDLDVDGRLQGRGEGKKKSGATTIPVKKHFRHCPRIGRNGN